MKSKALKWGAGVAIFVAILIVLSNIAREQPLRHIEQPVSVDEN